MPLSICIVTYNSAQVLPRCLESIRGGVSELGWEVVVVDNASGDGTADLVASEYPWVALVRSDCNLGFAAANNIGMARLRGAPILLLNPDTEVAEGALERMVEFLRHTPGAGAVGPRLVYPDGRLQLSCHDLPDLATAAYAALGISQALPRSRVFGRYGMTWWRHDEPRRVGWVSGAALMVTREAWERVGPLDERFFMYYEDADWQMRLRAAGLECWYLPEAVIVHHEAASWEAGPRALRRLLTAHRAAFAFYRKHYGLGGELAVRALTALGALGRALLCVFAWPLDGFSRATLARFELHLQVVGLSLGQGTAQ